MSTNITLKKHLYLAPVKPYAAYSRWSICVGSNINGYLESD